MYTKVTKVQEIFFRTLLIKSQYLTLPINYSAFKSRRQWNFIGKQWPPPDHSGIDEWQWTLVSPLCRYNRAGGNGAMTVWFKELYKCLSDSSTWPREWSCCPSWRTFPWVHAYKSVHFLAFFIWRVFYFSSLFCLFTSNSLSWVCSAANERAAVVQISWKFDVCLHSWFHFNLTNCFEFKNSPKSVSSSKTWYDTLFTYDK